RPRASGAGTPSLVVLRVTRRGLGRRVETLDVGDATQLLERDGALAHDPERRAGGVDDRRGDAPGRLAAVEVDRDGVAELAPRVGDVLRRGAAGAVGARDRERAGPLEQRERGRVVRHAQRDGATRVTEVPL